MLFIEILLYQIYLKCSNIKDRVLNVNFVIFKLYF